MTTVIRWLEHPVTETLGWSLLHFLWEGALIAMIVAILLAAMRRSTPQRHYLVLCGSLVLMWACPLITFSLLSRPIERPQAPAIVAASPTPPVPLQSEPLQIADQSRLGPMVPAGGADFPIVESEQEAFPSTDVPSQTDRQEVHWTQRWRDAVGPSLPWFVGGWLIGVSALSLRLLASWRKVQRMQRHGTTPAPAVWQECLSRLVARLRVRMPVKLVESALVEVPTVIGWLKPMILLPAAALVGLDPRELEALLAHELAHIRRHDYLINLLQTAIETLLFYHPAVWWLSRRIREERELCCDDLAVTVCGDGMVYARALATMEELRSIPALTLAADGGSLLARIRRICGGSSPIPDRTRPALTLSGFAVVSLAASCLVIALTAALAGRSAVSLQADESPKLAAAADFEKDANPVEPGSEPDNEKGAKLKLLIEAISQQESRFRSYSATVQTSREFQKPNTRASSAASSRTLDTVGHSDGASLARTATLAQQLVIGDSFQFVSDDITTMSSGADAHSKQRWVSNGTETQSIVEGVCATSYLGKVEPALMMPPHTWGMFHLSVSFPLSVYLSGTEALKSHPKAGRHPQEAGSIYEFYSAKAEVVDEDVIDELACTVVLVKRWYYTSGPPSHQYLWLAKDRNYHVVQSRTAFLRNEQEEPREESRVKKWRQLADDLWLPEIVEVVEISPESVRNKTTSTVIQRLMLQEAEWNPRTTDEMFKLPAIPENLSAFAVDAEHHLVGSPHHPKPIADPPSTTLEAILDRLTEEEKKYDPCEVILIDRYKFLNSSGGMQGNIDVSENRQRSVLSGARRYREQTGSSNSGGGESTQINRQAGDGRTVRSYSRHVTGKNNDIVNANASIALDGSRFPVSLDRAHTLIFRDHRESANSLTTFLKSGWYDKHNQYPMEVEYVGDEQIDELVCHKLKCRLQTSSITLWLARDRNLIPIRHEWHEPRWNAMLPTGVSFVEDFREIQPGIWCPYRITNLAFQKHSRDGLVVNQIVLQWRHDVTVERVTLAPNVDDRLFSELTIPADTKVQVQDEQGKYIGDYSQPETGRLGVSLDQLQELREKAKGVQEKPATKEETPTPKTPPSRQRGDTPTGKLLDRLEQQNAGPELFHDSWLRTIKEIVEAGAEAVPELNEELDATENDRMLRCLGFLLRAIGDKRAVPALIRAIPRTLRKPGSDMGLNAYDADLFKFAQQHELNPRSNEKHYGFGRPVREVCGALQKLTGQQFNEQQIFGMFLRGVPPDRRQDRERYYAVAKTWADWWEQHWDEFVNDESYAKVGLPPLVLSFPPRPGAVVETVGSKSGLILQSVLDPQAKQVFYDIDSHRFAELPEKWRSSGDIRGHLDEIIDWARQQGFDLMGTDYTSPAGGQPVLALRGIGLQSWELNPERWKTERNAVTLEMLREEGHQMIGLLLRRNPEKSSEITDPRATASFLAVTSEQNPVLFHVGVEVQDDRKRPGTFFQGDPELNPVAALKGRRFAVTYLDVRDDPR